MHDHDLKNRRYNYSISAISINQYCTLIPLLLATVPIEVIFIKLCSLFSTWTTPLKSLSGRYSRI